MNKAAPLFICTVLLTGCVFQGDKLQFESLARGESSYRGEDPLLFVVTSYDDTAAFTQYIGIGTQDALKRIDYQQYVVICVFLGCKGEGSAIEIKELIRKEEAIVLLTVFQEPELGKTLPGYASPFHLIKVSKSEIRLVGEVSFLLEDTRGFLHAKVRVEV
ncbi:MAG: hypothetical protein HXS46_18790 [Theionarchaea archaeon]|nr:MAG: hypothetical protein AYK18_09660 [Theionarchaea archaeon DG-70]MBU7012734.1 hypothetical protein [Theionarchaea archaeon]